MFYHTVVICLWNIRNFVGFDEKDLISQNKVLYKPSRSKIL